MYVCMSELPLGVSIERDLDKSSALESRIRSMGEKDLKKLGPTYPIQHAEVKLVDMRHPVPALGCNSSCMYSRQLSVVLSPIL